MASRSLPQVLYAIRELAAELALRAQVEPTERVITLTVVTERRDGTRWRHEIRPGASLVSEQVSVNQLMDEISANMAEAKRLLA